MAAPDPSSDERPHPDQDPDRLVDRGFWDDRHGRYVDGAAKRSSFLRDRLRGFVRGVHARVGTEPGEPYFSFLKRKVYRAHLPVEENWKCIEIGCAPGRNLIRFCSMFGYEPFGVEYSPVGAKTSRETLTEAGFDKANIFEHDLFDETFQAEHAERYNVVLSEGFIEHFDDMKKVIRAHMNLLCPGGYLVCAIPNLRSWGYPILAVTGRDLLRVHNCKIMRRGVYRELFKNMGLDERFCNYVGMFHLWGGISQQEKSLRGMVARVISWMNNVAHFAMIFFFRGRTLETRLSPHIVYVGQRRP